MNELICMKCNIALKLSIARFHYMGREMQSEVMKCPKCGQIYLPEKLVTDTIKHIEEAVEDK